MTLRAIYWRMKTLEMREDDEPRCHMKADALLIETIKLLNEDGPRDAYVDQIIESYGNVGKWYE